MTKEDKLVHNMRKTFMMFFKGKESIMDFMKKSKHIHTTNDAANLFTASNMEFSSKIYNNLWNSKERKSGDIKDFDVPFGQIGVRTKAGRNAWFTFTNKSKKDVATYITKDIINKFFSPTEIKRMDFLGINIGTEKEIERFATSSTAAFTITRPFSLNGKTRKYSQIALQGKYARSAPIVTHELVHTIYEVADRDLDEIVTELDALRRTKAVDRYAESDAGYYKYFAHKYGIHKNTLRKLIREDLKILEGCSSWEDVKKVATKTNLYRLARGKIKGNNLLKGCVESVDRYFLIEQGKRKIRIHTRGKPGARNIPTAVRRWMKKKGVKVYEWKDGKKVRLK